jgi:perosamine synthetase
MSHPLDKIPVCAPVFVGKEREYLLEAIDSGWISSMGSFLGRFESKLAELCSVRHVEACCNGTAALHLLLHAMGIGPGDEVIVPSLTFVASANAVLYCGATPSFCDIDPASWVIDPADALRRVTPKTKAIVGVDLFGTLADYDALRAGLAAMGRADVKLVEDAAEAFGSSSRGRPAGSLADGAIFSFFGNKTITTGEGGAVTTDDDALGARMKFLKNHGMHATRRYYHPELGFNFRMTNLQAAVGLAQLETQEELCSRKIRTHARYRARLAGLPGVQFAKIPEGQRVVPWLHVLVDAHLDGEEARDALLQRMLERGVETRPFFGACHTFPYFAACPGAGAGALPHSELAAATGLCLPSGGALTDDQIDRVAEAYAASREGLVRRAS